jgi:hypothetical protein
MHSIIGKNLPHRLHGAASEFGIRRKKREHLKSELLRLCKRCRPIEDHQNEEPHKRACPLDLSTQSSKMCRQKPASLFSPGNAVDVMIVLAGSVCWELGANRVGYVRPDFTDSCRQRPSCHRRDKRQGKQLLGPLLDRQAFGFGLSAKGGFLLVRQIEYSVMNLALLSILTLSLQIK